MKFPRNISMTAAACGLLWAICSRPITAQSAAPGGFTFFHEFYGSRGYTDPEAALHLERRSANGVTFSPPVESGVAQLAEPYGAGLMLRLAGASSPAGMSDSDIERQRVNFETLAGAKPQLGFLWDLMPEWDQSGGAWVPDGRPRYAGLSRATAHQKFVDYYRQRFPALMNHLNRAPDSRKYQLAAVTDYAMNASDAYDFGIDLCLLERGVDELGDLSTGIAFLRGAARQRNRAWGIDLSSWRTSNGMATQYDNRSVLLGGWSASYLSRHYYAAFLSGANVIQNEAATYRGSDGRLNPFGAATEEFADFALRRHADLGQPEVTTAFLVSRDHGFDPKHGVFNQANAVWYQDLNFTSGDFMIDNLLRLAYPNHWLYGLAPGAPFADSRGVPDPVKFRSFLAAGGDPRPYEPMPSTRWGDNVDMVTTDIGDVALRQYKTIVLLGDVTLDSRLRVALAAWVQDGGILAINADQMGAADQALTGVTLKGSGPRDASSSRWLSKNVKQAEAPYRYTPVLPDTAEVLAVNEFSDPLITRQKSGRGDVYLTTASFLQSAARDRLLDHAAQLLDSLVTRNAAARVSGPPIEYILNRLPGKIAVGLINNSGAVWNGSLGVDCPMPDVSHCSVQEYTTEQAVAFESSAATMTIGAQVPPYGVRVFAVEFSSSSTPPARAN